MQLRGLRLKPMQDSWRYQEQMEMAKQKQAQEDELFQLKKQQLEQSLKPETPEFDMDGFSSDLSQFINIIETNPNMAKSISGRLAAKYPFLKDDLISIANDPQSALPGLKELQGRMVAKEDAPALSNSQKNFKQHQKLRMALKEAQKSGDESAIAEAAQNLDDFETITGKFKMSPVEKNRLKQEHDKETKRIAKLDTYATVGLESADQIPTIMRSLELLESVKTSGFRQALLNAQQWFGVEGGDESELSYNLGKNILSQLKQIFGAQFTEKEGAKLEQIESNFGRGVESNKRLLRSALSIVERSARRGMRAARDNGDDFTADEIEFLLDEIKRTDFSITANSDSPAMQATTPQVNVKDMSDDELFQ